MQTGRWASRYRTLSKCLCAGAERICAPRPRRGHPDREEVEFMFWILFIFILSFSSPGGDIWACERPRACVCVLCDPTAFLRRVHNRVRWAFGRRNGNNKTEFVSFRMLKNTNPFIIIHSISHSKHCWMRGNKFARISRTSPSSEASSR